MAKISTTLAEVISRVDALKPNAFTNEQKTEWINKVESAVQTEIMDVLPENLVVYDYETDHDKELLVTLPHRDIYDRYLMAMIDFMAGDIPAYANSMTMYNSVFDDARKALRQRHKKVFHFTNWW